MAAARKIASMTGLDFATAHAIQVIRSLLGPDVPQLTTVLRRMAPVIKIALWTVLVFRTARAISAIL